MQKLKSLQFASPTTYKTHYPGFKGEGLKIVIYSDGTERDLTQQTVLSDTAVN